jgi:hypothetical protein
MASKHSVSQNVSSTPMIGLRRLCNSQESLGRYSERSLHAAYLGRYGGGKCVRM